MSSCIKVIDLGGDVLVINPQSKVKFLVSLRVLVLVSPVFGAMFSLNYSEGAALVSAGDGARRMNMNLPLGGGGSW